MSQPALVTTERDWEALVAQTTVVLRDAEDVRQRITATEETQQDSTATTQKEPPMADPERLPEPGYDLEDDTTEDERRRRLEEEVDAQTQADAEEAAAAEPDLEPS